MRTLGMSDTLITIDGMIHDHAPLTTERVLDLAAVDAEGRILVRMLDILALMRLDANAEIVLVRFRIGTSRALSVRELTICDDLFVILAVSVDVDEVAGIPPRNRVVPKLWSVDGGTSCAIESVSAMSFATFVGRS